MWFWDQRFKTAREDWWTMLQDMLRYTFDLLVSGWSRRVLSEILIRNKNSGTNDDSDDTHKLFLQTDWNSGPPCQRFYAALLNICLPLGFHFGQHMLRSVVFLLTLRLWDHTHHTNTKLGFDGSHLNFSRKPKRYWISFLNDLGFFSFSMFCNAWP